MIVSWLIVACAFCISKIVKLYVFIKNILIKTISLLLKSIKWVVGSVLKVLFIIMRPMKWILKKIVPIEWIDQVPKRKKKEKRKKDSNNKKGIKYILSEKMNKIYLELRKYEYFDLFMLSARVYSRKGKRIRFYKVNGLKDFCKQNNIKYNVIEEEKERTVYIPPYWAKSDEESHVFTSPETYTAELNNAIVMGATNIVIVENQFLSDMLSADNEGRVDLRDGVLRKIINNYGVVEEENKIMSCDYAISLVGAASYNFYHMLIEILPKLIIVDQNKEYRNVPILVDEVVLRIPQYKEALDRVNKYNHPVIKVNVGEKWKVSKLVYASINTWMPINVYNRYMIKTSDFMISESYLYNMAERVLSSLETNVNKEVQGKRYFISRKNTATVRLRNEKEVRDLFVSHGFEILYPEELTFVEQIECFSNADYIVASSGAALANIIFCEPDTKIICMIPKEFEFHMYSTIAYIFKLQALFLDCEVTERTDYPAADGYVLDIEYAKEFIEKFVEK